MPKLNFEKFLESLNEKWSNKQCPMCGQNDWNLSDTIFELREYSDGNLVLGGAVINPVVPVTCKNCGNIVFVNPIVISAVTED